MIANYFLLDQFRPFNMLTNGHQLFNGYSIPIPLFPLLIFFRILVVIIVGYIFNVIFSSEVLEMMVVVYFLVILYEFFVFLVHFLLNCKVGSWLWWCFSDEFEEVGELWALGGGGGGFGGLYFEEEIAQGD